MKNIEISIQLDPVNDGVNSFPTDVRMKGRGALVIGTNGNYRFIAEDEAIEIMDKLSGCCETEYIGKTSWMFEGIGGNHQQVDRRELSGHRHCLPICEKHDV